MYKIDNVLNSSGYDPWSHSLRHDVLNSYSAKYIIWFRMGRNFDHHMDWYPFNIANNLDLRLYYNSNSNKQKAATFGRLLCWPHIVTILTPLSSEFEHEIGGHQVDLDPHWAIAL